MIITLREPSNSESLILCLREAVTEKEFLRRAKVRPGSYAFELFTGLYASIFIRSLDLKRDYADYFAVEYPTFGEYLRERLLWDREVVLRVSKQFRTSRQIIYLKGSHSFLDHDYGPTFLERLLKSGRTT